MSQGELKTRTATSRCPICGAPTAPAFRPFCSQRCADIDLGRWMTGAYAVPAEEEDLDEETTSQTREGGAAPRS
ncbi:MAG: DNA gyrase inhibitor YacG [Pseudomonadota bacterium]